jgi:hypothetical protein
MKIAEVIPADQLGNYFDYDPSTSRLFWRKRTIEMDPRNQQRRLFNSRFAGKEAFTAKNSDGYLGGKLMGQSVKAHHVIWALVNGEWPIGEVDHINGNRSDNRVDNLRLTDKSGNQRNASRRKDNTSGQAGVTFNVKWQRWSARINANGKRLFLGWFGNFEDAVAARKEAEAEYGYHPNHGRAA